MCVLEGQRGASAWEDHAPHQHARPPPPQVLQANDLVRGASHSRTLTAYVKVKVGEKSEIVPPVTSRESHRWMNRNVYEFHGVK